MTASNLAVLPLAPPTEVEAAAGKPTIEPEYNSARPDWTPLLARKAYHDMHRGVLTDAADMCDAIRSDSRVRGVLQTRTNGLLGTDLCFEPVGDARRNGQVVRALDDDGEFWEMYPEAALAQIFLWGLLLNCGLAEIVWVRNPERDNAWQQRFIPKHPRNLRWDFETRSWKLTVLKDNLIADEIEIAPGNGRWIMFSPFGDSSPWAQGLWWALGLTWLSKQYATFDWDRRNESRGRSALVGTTPEGSGDKDRETYAQQLALLRTQLGIALPPGYDLKAVEFGGDDHQTFQTRIEACDANFAILVLGQNLTTEVKAGGSYAAGRSQERVRQDYLEQDAQTFSTCLRMQAIRHFANVRFADSALAPYPKWNTEPPENLANSANVIARASEALDRLLARNVPVDVPAYLAKFKIPALKQANGKILTGPEAPALPPAGKPKPAKGDGNGTGK
jgi:hypothetical protein